MNIKVYKLEVMIIDFDRIGAPEAVSALENANYPNDCISPNVMLVQQAEIEWSDNHPLNNSDTILEAYNDLFRTE